MIPEDNGHVKHPTHDDTEHGKKEDENEENETPSLAWRECKHSGRGVSETSGCTIDADVRAVDETLK